MTNPPPQPNNDDPNEIDTTSRGLDQHRQQIRQRIAAQTITPEQQREREQRRQERELKKIEAIANAERDAPIRVRFHSWMERSGFRSMQIPEPGRAYSGSHTETLWEAYLDATLRERETK